MAKADTDESAPEASVTPIKDPIERTDAALDRALDLKAELERESALRRGLEDELGREREQRLRIEDELQRATTMIDSLLARNSLRAEKEGRRRGPLRRRRR